MKEAPTSPRKTARQIAHEESLAAKAQAAFQAKRRLEEKKTRKELEAKRKERRGNGGIAPRGLRYPATTTTKSGQGRTQDSADSGKDEASGQQRRGHPFERSS